MKKLFLLLPALTLLTAAYAGGDSSEKQVTKMLTKFYKSYITEKMKPSPDEEVLEALIEENTSESFREMWGEAYLDCDVFTWTEEYDKRSAKTVKAGLSDDNYDWTYKVTFKTSHGSEVPMWINVVHENGRWVIDDIDNLHLSSDDDYDSSYEVGYTDTDEFVFLGYDNEGGDPRLLVLTPYSFTEPMALVDKLDFRPEVCRGDKITVAWEIGEVTEDEDGDEDPVIWAMEITGLKFGPVTKFRRTGHAAIAYTLRGDWTDSQKAQYTAAAEYFLATLDQDDAISEYLANTGGKLSVTVSETEKPSDISEYGWEIEASGEDGEYEADPEHPVVWLSMSIKNGGQTIVPEGGVVIKYGEYGDASYYRLKEREPFYYERVDIDADF